MLVSLVVVAHNEENYLLDLIEDFKRQTYNHKNIEIILIDSLSSDNTAMIFEEFKNSENDFFDIVTLKNEKKYLPHGCNLALEKYRGDIFLRIDAHATIPSDFVLKNVENIRLGEKISGGPRPNIIKDKDINSLILLEIEQSLFGSSIANYRSSQENKYVDSIFHGAYSKEVFDKVGKYNEKYLRTEDNDMSYRIGKAGYKMYYDSNIVSYQYTRPSLKSMIKQKFLNGYWIGKTSRENYKIFSWFHFVPCIFVLSIFLSMGAFLFGISFPLLVISSLYSFFLVLTTISIFLKLKSIKVIIVPVVLLSLHISYGLGTLKGLIEGI